MNSNYWEYTNFKAYSAAISSLRSQDSPSGHLFWQRTSWKIVPVVISTKSFTCCSAMFLLKVTYTLLQCVTHNTNPYGLVSLLKIQKFLEFGSGFLCTTLWYNIAEVKEVDIINTTSDSFRILLFLLKNKFIIKTRLTCTFLPFFCPGSALTW